MPCCQDAVEEVSIGRSPRRYKAMTGFSICALRSICALHSICPAGREGFISYRIAKRYIDFAEQKYRAAQAAYRQIDEVSGVPARDDVGIVPLYNKVRFREMHNYDRMVGLLWIGAAPYGGVC